MSDAQPGSALTLRPESTALLVQARAHAEALDAVISVADLSDPAHAAQASEAARALASLRGQLDDARKAEKKPHADAAKAVDDEFRGPIASVDRVSGMIRRRLEEAILHREREREAEVARLAAAVKARDAEAVNAAALAVSDPVFATPVAGPGIAEKLTWEVSAVRLDDVPREYLSITLDMPKVRAEIAAANREGRAPSIPGVEFTRAAGVAVKRL